MRLCKFKVRNFKNIEEVELVWEDIAVLIGENNVGKSTVLQALGCFLSGKAVREPGLFPREKKEMRMELIGHFDQLTEWERGQAAVKGRMHGEEWVLRKSFWWDEEARKWEEEYAAYGVREVFAEWPDGAKSWKDWPYAYQPLIGEVKARLGSPRPTKDALEVLKESVRERLPGMVSVTEPEFVPASGWKTNANEILPRWVYVPAVQEASDAVQAKGTTPYGQILNLVVEQKLAARPEVQELQAQLDRVQALIGLAQGENPQKAAEIREAEDELGAFLEQVIAAKAQIVAEKMQVADVLLPHTLLKLDDGFSTAVGSKGHGLQRTLVMALLQVLAKYGHEAGRRSVIFAVEEPELYMHPQMERKMRDALYGLAEVDGYQVICTTHSPVFLDLAQKHRSIVRLEKREGRVRAFQVLCELFEGPGAAEKKKKLRLAAEFDPAVNELFFAKRVVLVEGATEMAVFRKAAELMGVFQRAPHARRDTTIVNCHGKWTIPLFVEVLNHFEVGHVVFHDEDSNRLLPHGASPFAANAVIGEAVKAPNVRRMFSPTNLEGLLGYSAEKDKPIRALERVEELWEGGELPEEFCAHVYAAWGVESGEAELENIG